MNHDELDDFDSIDEESALDGAVEVQCPHCGESVTIAVDPSGGEHQEYVEDCQVCCRPWQVTVENHEGSVSVTLEPT